MDRCLLVTLVPDLRETRKTLREIQQIVIGRIHNGSRDSSMGAKDVS